MSNDHGLGYVNHLLEAKEGNSTAYSGGLYLQVPIGYNIATVLHFFQLYGCV